MDENKLRSPFAAAAAAAHTRIKADRFIFVIMKHTETSEHTNTRVHTKNRDSTRCVRTHTRDMLPCEFEREFARCVSWHELVFFT